ncbi:MAG: TRAP transporter large permease subunit [Desulfobacterales bacterium]|nr:TRAP transporter large permease subunit [Desulfobacterales bacterium]MDX2512975.1 TRAP transporter large permease subunit [Desulfobacterales bacterium]
MTGLERLEQNLGTFNRKVTTFFNRVSCLLLFIMPIPVFLDVLARYFFASSIPGVIEIEGYMLLGVVFLALAYTQFSDGHIRIDLFISKLPEWARNTVESCNYLICTLFFLLMSTQLFKGGLEKIASQEISYDLEIPTCIFWFLASFGTLLLSIAVFQDFISSLNRALKDCNKLLLATTYIAICIVLSMPMLGTTPPNINATAVGLLGMLLLFALLFLGMPIGFGMATTGYLGMILIYKGVGPAQAMLGIGSVETGSSYMLTVIPLFILMGELAYRSGISQDLFDTANKWLGRAPGGLAMSAVAGCAGFSAVCGDSLATAVTMGTIAVPEMKKKRYNMRLATGCVAAGGTLGILIPPSVGFIFYAIVTEESIGELFIAGLIPGLLLAALFMGSIYITAVRNPDMAPRGESSSFREKLASLKGIIGMLLLFVLILGGILSGLFSPIEGGAIGSVGAFVFALARRRITREQIMLALEGTLVITTKLMLILIGVGILGYFLAATQLPFSLAEFVTGLDVNRYFVFAAVIVLFMLLGCLLNVIPMILLVLPTIFPSIVALGFDPIWFGVVTVLTMEMGQITPPIGVNVFAIASVNKDVPMQEVFRGIVPFFFCMVICVVLLTIFPQLVLFLPNLLF